MNEISAGSVENALVELIPETLRGVSVDENVYCLALSYGYDLTGALPPVLGLGLESERQAAGDDPEMLWNPAEFALFATDEVSLRNSRYQELFDLYNVDLKSSGDVNELRRLLNDVAVKLNRLDWREILPVTNDFKVYAVDDDLADLDENLKFVSAEK